MLNINCQQTVSLLTSTIAHLGAITNEKEKRSLFKNKPSEILNLGVRALAVKFIIESRHGSF